MTDETITKASKDDDTPRKKPKLLRAGPLSIQHVLVMFISNVAPAILIGSAAGLGDLSSPTPALLSMVQMAILFAGIATILQTITLGPIGARLPLMQATSLAFVPIMIPLVEGKGIDGLTALYSGIIIGGVFHMSLGVFVGRLRYAMPPVVTGLIVVMIALTLIPLGFEYAAGGSTARLEGSYGDIWNWAAAIIVISITIGLRFWATGFLSVTAVFFGLVVGYIFVLAAGIIDFDTLRNSWTDAATFSVPTPLQYGFTFSMASVLGFCLMAIVATIETTGAVSGITRAAAGREATRREMEGATYADGIGTAIAGAFGALPTTSSAQNVGLVALTGSINRHVVTLAALLLVLCGFLPKIGAIILTIPPQVFGGAMIVMFGMVAAAGAALLSDVDWTPRNMIVFAVPLAIGIGLQQNPEAVQNLPEMLRLLLETGLFPAALLAILLNTALPAENSKEDGNPLSQ